MVVIIAFFIVGLSLLVSWIIFVHFEEEMANEQGRACLLYTSDAADERLCVYLGGRRSLKKKKKHK